jgi:hypothetical protein
VDQEVAVMVVQTFPVFLQEQPTRVVVVVGVEVRLPITLLVLAVLA